MNPDIEIIYQILAKWAENKTPKTYKDLSNEYYTMTGEVYSPHGTWDRPLGKLNKMLAEINAPAITALVVLSSTQMPGGSFWGCAANVPSKPKNTDATIAEWIKILNLVLSYPWPTDLSKL